MMLTSEFKGKFPWESDGEVFSYWETCSLCGTRTEMITRIKEEEGREEVGLCSDCDYSERERKKRERMIAERLALFKAKVPKRYAEIEPSSDSEMLNGYSTILWGSVGIGKTWRAYSFVKWAFLKGIVSSFEVVTESAMMNELKDFENQGKNLKKFKDTGILVLDEFGKLNRSDYNLSMVFDVLNHRYDNMGYTILICNGKTKDDIREIVQPALLDRFRENVIEMQGKSRRYREMTDGK